MGGLLCYTIGEREMRLVLSVLALLVVSVPQAHAQQNYESASYVLPLCKTWLEAIAKGDLEAVGSLGKTNPTRLITSGMCAGLIIGIAQTLRMFRLACPPDSISNEQLVRMVIEEIEKNPGQMAERFSLLASERVMIDWPCNGAVLAFPTAKSGSPSTSYQTRVAHDDFFLRELRKRCENSECCPQPSVGSAKFTPRRRSTQPRPRGWPAIHCLPGQKLTDIRAR